MDDPLQVRAGQPVGDRRADLDGLSPRKRGGRKPISQRLPFEQLRHDEEDALVLSEIVDGQNVRMRQRGDGLGFALETRHRVGILGAVSRKDLDRHLAPESRVPSPVHLAHPARAERRQDLVRAEPGSRGQSQDSERLQLLVHLLALGDVIPSFSLSAQALPGKRKK